MYEQRHWKQALRWGYWDDVDRVNQIGKTSGTRSFQGLLNSTH